jgi:hypothetical protein
MPSDLGGRITDRRVGNQSLERRCLPLAASPTPNVALPTTGIGTEFLAHREKIEVTQHSSTCGGQPGCLARIERAGDFGARIH